MQSNVTVIDSIGFPDGYFDIEGEPILERLIKRNRAFCEPGSFKDKTAFLDFVKRRMVAFEMTFDLDANCARVADEMAEQYGIMHGEIGAYLRSISGDGIVALVEDRITRSSLEHGERKVVRLLYLADAFCHAEAIEFKSMREMVKLGAQIGSYEVSDFKGSLLDVEGPYNSEQLWNRAEPLMRSADLKHSRTARRIVS